MKISNVRIGFAANSSSTHSIIFNLENANDHSFDDDYFGWQEFCAHTAQAKSKYLAYTLYHHLIDSLSPEISKAVVRDWLQTDVNEEGSIDHQSLMSLPYEFGKKCVSHAFFKELCVYFLQDKISIVGGNDNDPPSTYPYGRNRFPLPTDEGTGRYICKQDGNWWTLFNRYNGTKIRMSFQEDPGEYTKAKTPDLTDVRLTNFCPYNCRFCYMDSTMQGKHAEKSSVDSILWKLSEMEVFEVAFGGGEPTMHPEFAKIIKNCDEYYHIVPNFTTFNMQWVHNHKILSAVKQHVGRFAVSVDSSEKVLQCFGLAQEYGLTNKLSFHYVMNTGSEDAFDQLLKAVSLTGRPLVLLGFKETGRGNLYQKHVDFNWIKSIKASDCKYRIGIDTKLAQQYHQQISQEIPSLLVTYKEGAFSMYVDAVDKKCAESSYVSDDKKISFENTDDLKEIFQNF